ncbi:hypothetical protein [uncultured Sphingomonas sp.]|uniref:hypothetical protein n=1 Tax=uncultured Sphingomonas sp. TaxID=158754 RepID=UPI0025E67856|nr:hypothetical protein [uncultured Sphingomonas sp.]
MTLAAPTDLAALGPRICILGPSGSGKSTLGVAIGRRQALPVVHLDQLHHLPGTEWVPRPAKDFLATHDPAIAADRWVMEGNYTRLLPQRLTRATGLSLLDVKRRPACSAMSAAAGSSGIAPARSRARATAFAGRCCTTSPGPAAETGGATLRSSRRRHCPRWRCAPRALAAFYAQEGLAG